MESLDQSQEIDPFILEINAVGSQMDPCQDDLPVAFLRQNLYFLFHVLRTAASDASSRIRNNTVAAELVAAVLNFNEGAGMLCLFFDMEFLVFIGTRKVRDGLFDRFSREPCI